MCSSPDLPMCPGMTAPATVRQGAEWPGVVEMRHDAVRRGAQPQRRRNLGAGRGEDGRRLRRHRLQRLRRPARSAPVRTVGGVLAQAVGKVLRPDVDLTCAGRTDAGVHAWGQVVSFESEPGLDEWRRPARSIRCSVPRSSSAPPIWSLPASTPATPRSRAIPLHDRQPVGPRPVPRSFRVVRARPLDLRALRFAADPFVGEHDFASFCRKGPEGCHSRGACWILAGTTKATACSATRSAPVVLLADGALHRRLLRRGRPGQMPARRHLTILRAAAVPGRDVRAVARPVPLGSRLPVVSRPGACCPSSSARLAGSVNSEAEGSSNLVTTNASTRRRRRSCGKPRGARPCPCRCSRCPNP